VFYRGFDNVDGFKDYFNIESPNLLALVFGFGLIHGFGLSIQLQQLPLGHEGLLLKILSFYVVVEVGQILALAVMLLLLKAWRTTELFKKFSTVSNVGLMIAGVLLFLLQMHGYFHDLFVDELAFSKKAHYQEHHYENEQAAAKVKEGRRVILMRGGEKRHCRRW